MELLDVYPTLVQLCGLRCEEPLEGVSLEPLLIDPERPWERPAYTQVHRSSVRGYSVRTERWRYTEWGASGSDGVELYDHDHDPDESRNLSKLPEYAAITERLRAELRKISQRPAAVPAGER